MSKRLHTFHLCNVVCQTYFNKNKVSGKLRKKYYDNKIDKYLNRSKQKVKKSISIYTGIIYV